MGVPPRSSSTLRVLLVDVDEESRRTLRRSLEGRIARPLMILETESAATARAMVVERAFDVIAADLVTVGGPARLPELATPTSSAITYAMGPRENVRDAVAAVRNGAADYIEKPIDGLGFARRIERQFVGLDAREADAFEGMTGHSPAMQALFQQIDRIAPAAAPVFIMGESGTGKGLVARAVHARSRRRSGPFIIVDCGGKPEQDLVPELESRGGAFDRCEGGTLLLDEVGQLPDAVQAMLLRLLDGGEIGLHGERRRAQVRVIASTNRRPADLVEGGLRTDLYFRLNVLTLTVPPLRERIEDVLPLTEELIRRAARERGARVPRLSPSAERALRQHGWPGNVRELKNLAERVAIACEGDMVSAETVAAMLGPSPAMLHPAAQADARPVPLVRPLWMEEERIIEAAIVAFDGNIAKAAAALEISPSTIYRKRRSREGEVPAMSA